MYDFVLIFIISLTYTHTYTHTHISLYKANSFDSRIIALEFVICICDDTFYLHFVRLHFVNLCYH